MPGARSPMRKVRDVLRLSAAGMSKRQIAASLGLSATAARDCIARARRSCLEWPLPADLTDDMLEARLYPPPAVAAREPMERCGGRDPGRQARKNKTG